jgi:hypothetical protein
LSPSKGRTLSLSKGAGEQSPTPALDDTSEPVAAPKHIVASEATTQHRTLSLSKGAGEQSPTPSLDDTLSLSKGRTLSLSKGAGDQLKIVALFTRRKTPI